MSFNGKNKAITFSYDDGVSQDIRLIELLNKYGLKSTFNLNSAQLGNHTMIVREGKEINFHKIPKEDIKTIYAGHEIASHTLTHPNLTKLTKAEIITQVENDRLNLSEIAGYEVVGFAYPCGSVNNDDRVAEIIKNNTGVKYCRTITDNGSFDLQKNLHRFNPTAFHIDFDRVMELGQKFIDLKTDVPQIFYIWGHSFEMEYSQGNWDRLEEFFKLISGKDDIFYGTNKEVLL